MKPEWWYYDDWQYQLKKDREAKRKRIINKILEILRLRKYQWELIKLFKRGQIIIINPSMKCNLNCSYCSIKAITGRFPEYYEYDYHYWIDIIWKEQPKMVAISGGEPGIYKDLHKIVNYCIRQKILVQIVTNLTDIDEYVKIKPSWRVIFWSTYHHSSHKGRYLFNYDYLKFRFVIVTKELEKPKELPFSRSIQLKTEFENKQQAYKIYAPDGRIFHSCYDISLNGKK